MKLNPRSWQTVSLATVCLAVVASLHGFTTAPSAMAQEATPEAQQEQQDDQNSADDAPERPRNRDRGRRRGFGGWGFRTPSWLLTHGRDMRGLFGEVVSEAAKSMVCVHCDGNHRILGCVVGEDGWVLTKASELDGELTVHNAADEEFPAELIARDNEYDVALLKAEGLVAVPPLDLTEVTTPGVGAWVATVGKMATPVVAVGVVSVPPREIAHQPGVLGVHLGGPPRADETVPPIVEQVLPDTAAEEAGVQVDDLILSVDGKQVSSRDELIRTVQAHYPGDIVEIVLRRDGAEVTLSATLGSTFGSEFEDRSDMQNMMGGRLSDRRFGFPTAFQHDTVLRPMDCGGPIVNLDGKVVGINIARSGRTESYAIEVDAVRRLLEKWMSEAATASVSLNNADSDARDAEVPVDVSSTEPQPSAAD